MPWKKGESGNPGGRAKEVNQIRSLARDHAIGAMLKLVEIMDGNDHRLAVQAAIAILDRGLGKPAQSVDLFVDDQRAETRESILARAQAIGVNPEILFSEQCRH